MTRFLSTWRCLPLWVGLVLCPWAGFAEEAPSLQPWTSGWVQKEAVLASHLSRSLRVQAKELAPSRSARWTLRAGLAEELEILYRRNLTALNRKKSLEKEKQLFLSNPAQALLSPKEQYNLRDLDQLLDRSQAAANQLESLRLGVKVATSASQEAVASFHNTEQKNRSFEDHKQDPTPSPDFLWTQAGLKLEQKLAQARVQLTHNRLENIKLELDFRLKETEYSAQKIRQVREHLGFDPKDLARYLKELAQKRSSLQTRQRSLKKEQTEIEKAWIQAQDELERGRHPDYLNRAKLLLRTHEAWRDTYQKVLEQTETLLSWTTLEEHLWRHRYALLRAKPSAQSLNRWNTQISTSLAVLDRQIQLAQTEQTRLQSEQLAVPETSGMGKFKTKVIQNHGQALLKLIERGLEFQTRLQSVKALHLRTAEEINRFKKGLKLAEKISAVSSQAWQIWDLELWVIDDKPVTLKKALLPCCCLFLGLSGPNGSPQPFVVKSCQAWT